MPRFLKYENKYCRKCGYVCVFLTMGYQNRKKKEVGGRQEMAKICDKCGVREKLDVSAVLDMMEIEKPIGEYQEIGTLFP